MNVGADENSSIRNMRRVTLVANRANLMILWLGTRAPTCLLVWCLRDGCEVLSYAWIERDRAG